MTGRRWWTVPVNVAATVAWRLPSALMGVILFVVAGSMLGPPGLLLAAVWLVAGLVTLTRFGERVLARRVLRYRPAAGSWLEAEVQRLLARRVLRYRPAAGSWLEAEVQRLLPGRRVDVYVAPKACGVFALGGRTIGLGEASMGGGGPTPALQAATAAAVAELHAGRTRAELPLLWWCVPWWFAKQVPGRLLPRRWQPLLKVWAFCVVVAAIVSAVRDGHLVVVVLTGCAVTDLWISGVRDRHQRRPVHRQLQPAAAAVSSGGQIRPGYYSSTLAPAPAQR